MTQQPPIQAPVQHKGRQGFLPFPTNTFDRCFISVVIFVAISLLWMRFLEPLGAPLWLSTIISIVLAVWIVRKG
jgi:predicted small integral membrane protein